MLKKYLIDADVLIEAKNRHYQFGFCSNFWDWVIAAHMADMLFSIKSVKRQIADGKSADEVLQWGARLPNSFFLDDISDIDVNSHCRELVKAVQSKTQYKPQALNVFMDIKNADAWLIAVAKKTDAILITGEVSAPDSKSNIKIPDAAVLVGVPTTNIFKVLREHAIGQFQLKP